MVPDTIDLDELKTGQRREGIFYAFMVLLQKIGLAVGLFLVGISLESAGFYRASGRTTVARTTGLCTHGHSSSDRALAHVSVSGWFALCLLLSDYPRHPCRDFITTRRPAEFSLIFVLCVMCYVLCSFGRETPQIAINK
jgi:hypothetical protein